MMPLKKLKRAAHELKEFLIIAACFTALAYLKAAILEAQDIAFALFGFAVVKALICAKFLSIAYVFHLGERYKKQALIWPTLHRSKPRRRLDVAPVTARERES